jgi:hypothetical protein
MLVLVKILVLPWFREMKPLQQALEIWYEESLEISVQVCMKHYPVEIDELLKLGLQILCQLVVNLSEKYVCCWWQ